MALPTKLHELDADALRRLLIAQDQELTLDACSERIVANAERNQVFTPRRSNGTD